MSQANISEVAGSSRNIDAMRGIAAMVVAIFIAG